MRISGESGVQVKKSPARVLGNNNICAIKDPVEIARMLCIFQGGYVTGADN